MRYLGALLFLMVLGFFLVTSYLVMLPMLWGVGRVLRAIGGLDFDVTWWEFTRVWFTKPWWVRD